MLCAVTTNNVGLDVGGDRGDDDHLGDAHLSRRDQGLRGGLVEVHRAGIGGHRSRVRRHRARVFRLREPGAAGGGSELDRPQGGRALASPRGREAGIRVHPRGLRDQGGAGTDCIRGCRTPMPRRRHRWSAMMSGVLLAVALYAVVRWRAVVAAAVVLLLNLFCYFITTCSYLLLSLLA